MQPGRSYERLPLAARGVAAERQTPGAAAAEHPVPGKRTLTDALEAVPVQRVAAGPSAPAAARPGDIARRGVEGGGGPLPHGATIQQLFGRHDISHVTAHQGPAAREAANALGAEAFTYGDKIAFRSSPDLHTAAHEAAHAVQQRQGVQLLGGIDVPGDPYERHADAVADAVVAGQSAAALLDQMPGGGTAQAAVQRKWTRDVASPDADLDPDGPWYQDRDRVYRNIDTGDSYDPIHRIFDNRDEPASFHEVDDREHLELMRTVHGGRAISVYFDDSREQVYDPATRRLYPGRVLGERFRQLGADEHANLMAQIQLDLDYQEYLDSGEADYDDGEFRGRRDGYEDSEFRSEAEDCEHPDAYAEGYRDGYRQGVFERGYDRACTDFYEDRDFNDAGGGDHADDYAEGYAAGWAANRRTDGDDLPIFELTRNGRFVPQDDRGWNQEAGEDSRYYHIGRELAYTCDMKTCTALTMYSEATQLSYLKHVDAATDPEAIGAEIQDYLEQVAEAMPEDSEEDPIATINTRLFYGRQTSPDEDGGSIEAISNGIKAALQDKPGFKEFWSRIRCQKIGSEDRAGDTDYVVVGGGSPPALLQVPQPEFEAALAKIHQHETLTDLEAPVATVLRRLAEHADDIRAVIPADEIARAYAEAGSYDPEIQAALAPFLE